MSRRHRTDAGRGCPMTQPCTPLKTRFKRSGYDVTYILE